MPGRTGRDVAHLLADFGHDLPTPPPAPVRGREGRLFHHATARGAFRPGRGTGSTWGDARVSAAFAFMMMRTRWKQWVTASTCVACFRHRLRQPFAVRPISGRLGVNPQPNPNALKAGRAIGGVEPAAGRGEGLLHLGLQHPLLQLHQG